MSRKLNILPENNEEAMEGGINSINNLLNIKEIEQLIEEHLRSDDCHTAAFWAEKLLAIVRRQGDRSEHLPQIAKYLAVCLKTFFKNFPVIFINFLLFL